MARAQSGDELHLLTDDEIIVELRRREGAGGGWTSEDYEPDELVFTFDPDWVPPRSIETLPDIATVGAEIAEQLGDAREVHTDLKRQYQVMAARDPAMKALRQIAGLPPAAVDIP